MSATTDAIASTIYLIAKFMMRRRWFRWLIRWDEMRQLEEAVAEDNKSAAVAYDIVSEVVGPQRARQCLDELLNHSNSEIRDRASLVIKNIAGANDDENG